MTDPLSMRDWEQLSEYLDGVLSQRDRTGLEKRMASNLELQRGLDELKRTRHLLKIAPRRRAPRNFTLSPAMVKPRIGQRLFPYFSWASAVTTVLFMLSFIFRLFPLAASPGMMSADNSSALPAQESFKVREQSPSGKAMPTSAGPGITWGTPPSPIKPQMGGGVAPGIGEPGLGVPGKGGGEPPSPKIAVDSTATAQPPPTQVPPAMLPARATPFPNPSPTTIPSGTQKQQPTLQVPAAPAPVSPNLPSPAPRQPTPTPAGRSNGAEPGKVAPAIGPVLGIPTDKGGQIIETQPRLSEPVSTTSTRQPVDNLLSLQIGLGILALVLSITAIIFRTRFYS